MYKTFTLVKRIKLYVGSPCFPEETLNKKKGKKEKQSHLVGMISSVSMKIM